jgi:hypothetical protein
LILSRRGVSDDLQCIIGQQGKQRNVLVTDSSTCNTYLLFVMSDTVGTSFSLFFRPSRIFSATESLDSDEGAGAGVGENRGPDIAAFSISSSWSSMKRRSSAGTERSI